MRKDLKKTELSQDSENDQSDIKDVTRTELLDRNHGNESFDPVVITVIHVIL